MIEAIIPTSLNDITLGQMQRYDVLIKEADDEDRIRAIMLDVFCLVDSTYYARINAKQILSISQRIETILNTQPSHERFFVLDGVRYGFIPNLDDMTMGEFVDLDQIGTETKDWHKVMAVLYRPVTKTFGNRYLIEPYKGLEDASKYKEMPLGVALGAMLFFWTLGKELLNDTLNYLKQAETDQELNTHLAKSGVGTEQFMDSLKAISEELTRSHPYLSTNASIGLRTKVTYEN